MSDCDQLGPLAAVAPASVTSTCSSVRASSDPLPWRNWARNQEVFAKAIYRPRNLDELTCIVKEVDGRGGRLRGVGTGLSFSDVLQSDDALLQLTDFHAEGTLGVLLPLEEELWNNPTPLEPRVRVPPGARIGALNDALAKAGLGFLNLGGYDVQTMIGALSTSTHGSGIQLGPLPDAVLSLDLVSTGGKCFRIEPSFGITNRKAFTKRYPTVELLQCDDIFNSVVVSMGCMGVITSVTMRVRAAYRLIERRALATWSVVKAQLEQGIFRRFRHYEVSLNPYPRRGGDYTCIVTTRSVARPGTEKIPLSNGRERLQALLFLASSQAGLLRLMQTTPRYIPYVLEEGMRQVVTSDEGHIDDSYRIFNWGSLNTAEVLSGEYFFPIQGNQYIRAAERLIALMDDNRRRGIWQTSPISFRFIQASPAYLSMMHGGEQCSMEISMFSGLPYAEEALLSYEQATYELGGRVHWGQLHELSGHPGWLDRAYSKAADFRRVYRFFNAKGTFSNHFTDRMQL